MPRLAVATDFSTRSDRAIRRAELLAAQSGRGLVLIHVIDEDQPDGMIKAHRQQAEALLGELQQTLASGRGLNSQVEVRVGQAFDEIPQAAIAAEADLIVMGPHRPQLRDLVRGKTLERTIRQSPLPVLVANAFPTSDYIRVLLATTLDAEAAAALRSAIALPYVAHANHLLLQVYESLARDVQARSMFSSDHDEDDRAREDGQMHRELVEFATREQLPHGRAIVRAAAGPVGADILQAADEVEADLIVAGRSKKGALEAVFTGRASQALVRDATRDVLIVPVS
jgi:nucleotide-binding universal stress UspA family protein